MRVDETASNEGADGTPPGHGRAPVFVADAIRHGSFDGVVVLLDVSSEEYYALDERRSNYWMLLLGDRAERDEAVAGFSVEDRRAFDSFVDDCLCQRFLTLAPPRPPAPSSRRGAHSRSRKRSCLTVRAWAALVGTWARLRTRGFGATYAGCRGSALSALSASSDEGYVRSAVDAFVRAENLFAFHDAPDDCLPRSLSLFRYLQSLGIGASHHIGVMRFPGFRMHAWVEYAGRPLLDDPTTIARFTVLSTIP